MRRRRSAQREKILTIITARSDHPTAAQIFDELRRVSPSAGLGNMYRNLRILVEEGRVARRVFGDGIEHFDAVLGPHYHFVCGRCGAITDFPMELRTDLEEAARRLTGRAITGHTVQFFGLCESCDEKAGGKPGDPDRSKEVQS